MQNRWNLLAKLCPINKTHVGCAEHSAVSVNVNVVNTISRSHQPGDTRSNIEEPPADSALSVTTRDVQQLKHEQSTTIIVVHSSCFGERWSNGYNTRLSIERTVVRFHLGNFVHPTLPVSFERYIKNRLSKLLR